MITRTQKRKEIAKDEKREVDLFFQSSRIVFSDVVPRFSMIFSCSWSLLLSKSVQRFRFRSLPPHIYKFPSETRTLKVRIRGQLLPQRKISSPQRRSALWFRSSGEIFRPSEEPSVCTSKNQEKNLKNSKENTKMNTWLTNEKNHAKPSENDLRILETHVIPRKM
jgi:hypothetical protein